MSHTVDMSLPEALARERTDLLIARAASNNPDYCTVTPVGPKVGSPRRRSLERLRARARRLGGRLVRGTRRQVLGPASTRLDELSSQVAREGAELEALQRAVSLIHEPAVMSAFDRSELHGAVINLELLKGELRQLASQLRELSDDRMTVVQEQLGMLTSAIAPVGGTTAVRGAMSEIRERLTAVERRFRVLAAGQPVTGEAGSSHGASPDSAHRTSSEIPRSALFDYVGFERRFRGLAPDILAILAERYGDLLSQHGPVVDLGCGRGELLEWLKSQRIEALGIDTDPSMVADGQERGLDIRQADAVAFLRSQPEATLGSVIATHLAEHLSLDALVELLELSASRLRADGVLILETPNPTALIVLGNSYILDPTHVRPLHPQLMSFLCEGAGFRSVDLRFFAPATGYHLAMVEDPAAPPWVAQINTAFDKLNTVLFGAQDYAVVASPARDFFVEVAPATALGSSVIPMEEASLTSSSDQ